MNKKLKKLVIVSLFSGFALILTNTARAERPDFSICAGLPAAVAGLCRAGIAVGCADTPPTGNEKACTAIEDNFAEAAGADPPWLLPPCPCNIDAVPRTSATWTADVPAEGWVFDHIKFSCGYEDLYGFWTSFIAVDEDELSSRTEQTDLITTTHAGFGRCEVVDRGVYRDNLFTLTYDEVYACGYKIMNYAAFFMEENPSILVDDSCSEL